jgi:hypothetical protein
MKLDHNPLVTVVDRAPRVAPAAEQYVEQVSTATQPAELTRPQSWAVPEQSDARAKLHELRTGARDRL